MTGEEFGWLVLALAGLAGSALWSGTETSMYCLSRVRLAVRTGEPGVRGRAARVLAAELDRPDRVLATILLGNNACNYLGTLGLTAILEGRGYGTVTMIALQVAVLTPVLLVFGESVPKELFRVHADAMAPRVAPTLRAVRVLATVTGVLPLISVFSSAVGRLSGTRVTDIGGTQAERFAELLGESVSRGAISEEQARLAERALAFGRLRVRDVMVPWSRAAAVHDDWPRTRVVGATSRSAFSRVPVIGERGDVVGVAECARLQADAEASLSDVTGPAAWVDADSDLRSALVALRTAGTPLGLVGRSGRPLGLVTVKDLVEPLIGAMRAW